MCLAVAALAIDRDGEAVPGQAPRDRRAQAPRAARHQRDAPMRYRHVAIIPSAQHTDALQRRAATERQIRLP
jgi:hypothetical protein